MTLSEAHRCHLLEDSGIDPDTAEALGWRSATAGEVGVLVGFNVESGGIVIPYPDCGGYARVRLDQPHPFSDRHVVRSKDGTETTVPRIRLVRYLSPKDTMNHAYILPAVRQALENPRNDVAITEGEKKALAATLKGIPTIGLAGVWSWRGKSGPHLVGDEVKQTDLLGELQNIDWMGRQVWLYWDSDAFTNDQVMAAGRQIKEELRRRGATVRLVVFSDEQGRKVGLDDYLLSHSKDDLLSYAQASVISDAQRNFNIEGIHILLTSPPIINVALSWGDLVEGMRYEDLITWSRFRLAVVGQTHKMPIFRTKKNGSTWEDFVGDALDMVAITEEAPPEISPEEMWWGRVCEYVQNRAREDLRDFAERGTPYRNETYCLLRAEATMAYLSRRYREPIKAEDLWDCLRKRGAKSIVKRTSWESADGEDRNSLLVRCWRISVADMAAKSEAFADSDDS